MLWPASDENGNIENSLRNGNGTDVSVKYRGEVAGKAVRKMWWRKMLWSVSRDISNCIMLH